MNNFAVIEDLYDKINQYKRKYYLNQLVKGSLLTLGLLVAYFLVANLAEYYIRFNSFVRGFLLVSFLCLLAITCYYWIALPLFNLFKSRTETEDKALAKEIGELFPEIKDKLQNTLELAQLSTKESSLIHASILQRSNEFKFYNFADSISIGTNRRYLPYVLPPVLLLSGILLVAPSLITSPTKRIVYFQNKFAEPAPFSFHILNKELVAKQNQDFHLKLQLRGQSLPNEAYIVFNGRKFRMNSSQSKSFDFLFQQVTQPISFHFEAVGYTSDPLELKVSPPPTLNKFTVSLAYPSYLNKSPETLDNVGNLIIPAGTEVTWKFSTTATDAISLHFPNDNRKVELSSVLGNNYAYKRVFQRSADYEVSLLNKQVGSSDPLRFNIQVIADQYPSLTASTMVDSSNFKTLFLNGTINDDYGFSNFKLFYKASGDASFQSIAIPFNKSLLSQNFFYELPLAKIALSSNQKLDYFIQLWDNDAVNGFKSVKSQIFQFQPPSQTTLLNDISKDIQQAEKQFKDLIQQAQQFKKQLAESEKKLAVKKDLDFQDKKLVEDLLKKREQLNENIEKLKEQLADLAAKQMQSNQLTPENMEKIQELQQLIEELQRTAPKELLEQLQKSLDNKSENPSNSLKEFNKNERNLDRNIDRSLQLFKSLQLQLKVESLKNQLEQAAQKQQELAESDKSQNQQKEEQKEINSSFNDIKKAVDELRKLEKEVKKEVSPDEKELKEAEDALNKAKESLDKNDTNEAKKSQRRAARSMRNLSNQLAEKSKSAEMKQLDIDMDALRDILENLVKLSFEQERIMKDLKTISSDNPRFIELSQTQVKLGDDARIIEDSLFSLARRVLQIESFITKEVTEMRNNMDESTRLLKERKTPAASAKQQFAMTSMNNLALMLSDTFKQMQDMMMNMKGGGSGKGKMPMPGLGEKQQKINEQLQQLSEGQQQGKSLSRDLARLAQEQASIRSQLKALQERLGKDAKGKSLGNTLEQLQKAMDESETDIANKRINANLLNRQRAIQTRLLEAEKAIKEQELDPTRKASVGMTFERPTPASLQNFQRFRDKQTELLQTTPPQFTPFYKSQSTEYFKKIK